MKRALAIAAVASLVLVAGGAAADSFTLTVVSQTSTTITFSYPRQPGYGYLYSANGAVVSRTNDPTRVQVKFSKANSYEVAAIVKGTTGSYPSVVPPPPPPVAVITQTIQNGSTIQDLAGWRATYDAEGDGTQDDPGSVVFLVDGQQVLSETEIPFGDSFADGSITVPAGAHTFTVRAVNDQGVVLASSTVSATVEETPPPPPPPPPPPTGFPDASNTGVPSGTNLTAYNGPSTVTTAGTVIDGKSIACITISAQNVTIRNSSISCNGSIYYAVNVGSSGSVTVQDSNIDCRSTNSNGAGRMNITLVRVEITNCENGLSVAHDVTVRDSYIHALYTGGGAHADGMQFEGSAGNVNILHNTILAVDANGSGFTTTSALIADLSGHHDWLIENNLFSGGTYTVYCVLGKGSNWVIRNNAFSTKYGKNGTSGQFGFARECSDDTQSGNYVYETGQQINLG